MPTTGGEPERYPFRFVHAAKVAGFRSVAEFLDRDALEVEWWMEYALTGPTEIRTQYLLAALIQIVGSALGGRPMQLDKLLPWLPDYSGQPKRDRRSTAIAQSKSVVASMLAEARKSDGG